MNNYLIYIDNDFNLCKYLVINEKVSISLINKLFNIEIDILYVSLLIDNNININNIINLLLLNINKLKFNKIIIFDSFKIYDHLIKYVNEDDEPDLIINSNLGRNYIIFENFIKLNYNNYHIVRFPHIIKTNLKNFINNLICNNDIIFSLYQFYDLNWLINDLKIIIQNNLNICNLATEPIKISKICKYSNFNINYTSETIIQTKYSKLFGYKNNYIKNSNEIIL